MSDAQDPWSERLSEYLDGELEAPERSALETHLASCERCAALLVDLRSLVTRARALDDRVPERDPWPALRATLEAPARGGALPRWILAFAAGVVLTLAAVYALGLLRRPLHGERSGVELAAGDAFLLLLHEPEDFSSGVSEAEHAAIVERYATWARDLGARCQAGDELAAGGWELRPDESPVAVDAGTPRPGIGGYFLVRASDEEQALALARTCPHLDQGGWIELRRVQTP